MSSPRPIMHASTSSVAFPGSPDRNSFIPIPGSSPLTKPPHLPFRRMSSPSAPSLIHRPQSIVSVASFDSLPEEGDDISPRTGSPREGSSFAAAMQQHAQRSSHGPLRVRVQSRPSSHLSTSISALPPTPDSPRRRRRQSRQSDSLRPVLPSPVAEAHREKRRKIVDEFYESERVYVEGLELIYSHFLSPIISSLETSTPLLDRAQLLSVFSNFIDIWNFHREFFATLSAHLSKGSISLAPPAEPPPTAAPLSPVLSSHFPYLSLYTPFVTSFPNIVSSLTSLTTPPTSAKPNTDYNPAFASFIAMQEADPKCGRLRLNAWLLTIVQRCPRYLLLLKDLIKNTDPHDLEYEQLTKVEALVSKITSSLNTSLATHAQTLALLSLQRSTSGLPAGFNMISPGRLLIKRGPLLQLDVQQSQTPKDREFILFSDCLMWLANEESERAWDWGIFGGSGSTSATTSAEPTPPIPIQSPPPLSSPPPSSSSRPQMTRSRSKSEAELGAILNKDRMQQRKLAYQQAQKNVDVPVENSDPIPPSPSLPNSPHRRTRLYSNNARRSYHPPSNVRRNPSTGEEKWVFKGRVELVDLEVVVPAKIGVEEEDMEENVRKLEVLSPLGSFVIYTADEQERDEWVSAIRQAKAQLLVSLNMTNPNSTLTSSSSTQHLRKTLQALPYQPGDERLATIREPSSSGRDTGTKGGSTISTHREDNKKGKSGKAAQLDERRRKVENWVPAIWIPDEKTNECMRCGRPFSWRRRRHHCRLCGRCVCASCSGKTFFIADSSGKDGKPPENKPARACEACYESVFPVIQPPSEIPAMDQPEESPRVDAETIRQLPSWLSASSLATPSQPIPAPKALMSMSPVIERQISRSASHADDIEEAMMEGDGSLPRERVVKVKPIPTGQRSSYHQLFDEQDIPSTGTSPSKSWKNTEHMSPRSNILSLSEEDESNEYIAGSGNAPSKSSTSVTFADSVTQLPSSSQKMESTVRKSKRFSLPAVALQTLSVTARTSSSTSDVYAGNGSKVSKRPEGDSASGKRFSLVLSKNKGNIKEEEREGDQEASKKKELSKGVAARRLSDLLRRRKT